MQQSRLEREEKKKKTTSKVCIWLGKKPFISDTEFSKVLI